MYTPQEYGSSLSKGLLAASMAVASLAGPATGSANAVHVVRAGNFEPSGSYVADKSSGSGLFLNFHEGATGYLNSNLEETSGLTSGDPSEMLDDIQEKLIPNVKLLADVMGVSRQMIYRWRAGESVSEVKRQRLKVLVRFAHEWGRASGERPGPLLKRKVCSDRSLIDILSEREINEDDASQAMQAISSILRSKLRRAGRVRQEKSVVPRSEDMIMMHAAGTVR